MAAAASKPRNLAVAPLLALPGALTAFFAFNAGGYFPGSQAVAVGVLVVALVLRVTLAEHPFEGIGRGLAVALASLGLYAAWSLISAEWSDAPARALLEYDRALLYGLMLALFGSVAWTNAQLGWALRGVALAIAVVCVFALVSRLLPEVLPTAPNFGNERLSYPITYWNALGLLAAVGCILFLHLTSSTREPAFVRVAAAGALPLAAATLLLTFSRGAIVVAVLGALVYAFLGRPHGLLSGLLAAGPVTAVSIATVYSAELLATEDPTTPAAVTQGSDVAPVVVGCVAIGALIRGSLLALDPRLRHVRLSPAARRISKWSLAAGAALAILIAFVVFDAGAALGRQYDRFVEGDVVAEGSVRERLTSVGGNARAELWTVAGEAFGREPLTGAGAGTYQVIWARNRPLPSTAVDGHSVYLESLGELGAVGFLLLTTAIVAVLLACLRGARAERRSLYAALFAAGLAWAVHAGVDWDWEMPAVTAWFWALGGMALGARSGPWRLSPPARVTRLAVGIGLLVLAVTPVLAGFSQVQLDRSVDAFERGDCEGAIATALDSASAVGARPEPFEILAYCDSRLGLDSLAIQSMRGAVERDPENWEFHYGLAVVTAAAGLDPRPAAETARRLNPREPLAEDLVARFDDAGPKEWKSLAEEAPLPF